MQTFKFIQSLFFAMSLTTGLYAQTTAQKIDRTTNNVQRINNDVNVLKGHF